MTEQDVIDYANEHMEKWWEALGINRDLYKVCVGDTNLARGKFKAKKYAYGICQMVVGLIVIDYRHLSTGTEAMIKDTILHEIAHALDYEHHGYSSGHGKNWKRMAVLVGARPKATCPDTDEGKLNRVKTSKYAIIDKRYPTKARGYAQRKLKSMKSRYYPDDRSTSGNLFLVESKYFLTGNEELILNKMFQ